MAAPFDRPLVLILGKGGVGRSTVAAALGTASAKRGRKTLLFEFNANDRFGSFFGRGAVGGSPVQLEPNLWAINTSPDLALEEYGIMVLRFKRVYKLVFENRLTKYFLRAIPGLDDYSILGKAWFHTTEKEDAKPKWDTVIFDMAASGHALSMLRLPVSILSTVPDGPLTRDAALIRTLMRDSDKTSIVLTTLAEEMPSNEAMELRANLKKQCDLDVTHLVVNQIFPDEGVEDEDAKELLASVLRDSDSLPDILAPLAEHAALAQSRAQINREYREVLNSEFELPTAELPFLFDTPIGRSEIEELSRRLQTSFDSP